MVRVKRNSRQKKIITKVFKKLKHPPPDQNSLKLWCGSREVSLYSKTYCRLRRLEAFRIIVFPPPPKSTFCCASDNNLMRISLISQTQRTITTSTKTITKERAQRKQSINEVRPQCLRPRGNPEERLIDRKMITIASSLFECKRAPANPQQSDTNPRIKQQP